MSTRVDLVSFDADQTLFDFARLLDEALTATAGMLRAAAGRDITTTQLQDTRNRIAASPAGRGANLLDLRRMGFAAVLAGHPGAGALTDQAMETFQAVRFGRVYLMPGAEEMLAALAGRVRIACLTNGNSDPRKTVIGRYFDHVVLAEDTPYRKPDKRLFQILFARAGVTAARVLHARDSLTDDVAGARAAGAVPVWLNPGRAPFPGADAPAIIEDLRELPGRLP